MKNLQNAELLKIEIKISNSIKSIDPNAFIDGIISIKKYLESPERILWILKEPNSDEENVNWRDEIRKLSENQNLSGFNKTFTNIVYVTYGILNKKKWGEISFIKDDSTIINVLENIAFINIKKTPGGRSSIDRELENYYKKFKNVLLMQINEYKPTIIIGGNTIKFLEQDLVNLFPTLKHEKYVESSDLGILKSNKDNIIIFDARHPQSTNSTSKIYCNDIIENYLSLYLV